MSKKCFVNGPGLYWYDGMSMKKLKKPVKYGYDCNMPALKIPMLLITKKKRAKFIDELENSFNDLGKYSYYRGHDDAIDEILDDVE